MNSEEIKISLDRINDAIKTNEMLIGQLALKVKAIEAFFDESDESDESPVYDWDPSQQHPMDWNYAVDEKVSKRPKKKAKK